MRYQKQNKSEEEFEGKGKVFMVTKTRSHHFTLENQHIRKEMGVATSTFRGKFLSECGKRGSK